MTVKSHRLMDTLALPARLSPGALDLVKILALLAMILDHTNTLLLRPLMPELYAVGRIAFPLFAVIWAVNVYRNPTRLQHRANRLWLWGLITQPVFFLAFRDTDPWYALNILFVFAGVTQLLALHHHHGYAGLVAGLLILALMVFPLTPASYGLQGIILAGSLALFFKGTGWFRLPAAVAAGAALFLLNGASHLYGQPVATLVFAILPTMLLPLMAIQLADHLKPAGSERFMPRHFFYVTYAGHLMLLWLVKFMLA